MCGLAVDCHSQSALLRVRTCDTPAVAEPEEMSPLWKLARVRERERFASAIQVGQTAWRELAEIIADADDLDSAAQRVMQHFGLDADQATALLDMQFRHLARPMRERIETELAELSQETVRLSALIAGRPEDAGRTP